MTMNCVTLSEVAALAEQVAHLARVVEAQRSKYDEAWSEWDGASGDPPPHHIPDASPKLTGELRRRSMDLTRKLAEMRRA